MDTQNTSTNPSDPENSPKTITGTNGVHSSYIVKIQSCSSSFTTVSDTNRDYSEPLISTATNYSSAGGEDHTPPPITFTELMGFAGVCIGYTSAMLTYIQHSKTETYDPFQSHRHLGLSSAALLGCSFLGLVMMVCIHRKKTWKKTAAFITCSVLLMAALASVLVTVLVFLS